MAAASRRARRGASSRTQPQPQRGFAYGSGGALAVYARIMPRRVLAYQPQSNLDACAAHLHFLLRGVMPTLDDDIEELQWQLRQAAWQA